MQFLSRPFRHFFIPGLIVSLSLACSSDSPVTIDAGNTGSTDASTNELDASSLGQAKTVSLHFIPQIGISGIQLVNFAVPLPIGLNEDDGQIRLEVSGTEVPIASLSLASYSDGSSRSIQVQATVDFSGELDATLHINDGVPVTGLSLVPVVDTLMTENGETGPKVWTLLPATWLANSKVVGPLLATSEIPAGSQQGWSGVCDYDRYDVAKFLTNTDTRGTWLYDRVTTLYRGYGTLGEAGPLESAYREAHIYRNGITGTGVDTRIGVPSAVGDLKYHYTQGLAIHYLLTGDQRFRESAEDVADRIASLWTSPSYAGGADFWTERHAGFGLLGYTWASIVSDDRSSDFLTLADTAVSAYLDVMATYPVDWTDSEARCFAHTADAHGEDYGTWGCSPWMSAILAEALDVFATERGGTIAADATSAIIRLGRILARDGRDNSGKPYYFLGVGAEADEVDSFHEHWGETAYTIALAWYLDGKSDPFLRTAVDELMAGLTANGSAPHIRSFNWQCRGAVATPYYLQD